MPTMSPAVCMSRPPNVPSSPDIAGTGTKSTAIADEKSNLDNSQQRPRSCLGPNIKADVSAPSSPARPSAITRPQFNTHNTADRLREGGSSVHTRMSLAPQLFMVGNIKKGRKSVFKEVGLEEDELACEDESSPISPTTSFQQDRQRNVSSAGFSEKDFGAMPSMGVDTHDEHDGKTWGVRYQRKLNDQGHDDHEDDDKDSSTPSDLTDRRRSSLGLGPGKTPWYAKLLGGSRRPRIRTSPSAMPPAATTSIHRLTMMALLIAVVLPALRYSDGGQDSHDIGAADAGVIRTRQSSSPTKICTRWAHQVAQLNGTLYIYGGQAKTSEDQELDTWNNNFLTLDLSQSWGIDEPQLQGLSQPDGPPAVSLGYLWQDYNNLYLYGGQFADNERDGDGETTESGGNYVIPEPMALWRYAIGDGTWSSFEDPETSAGNYSTDGGIAIQRAAEGAGLSVPELGLSWYFGGHLDVATTRGWSNQVPRLYLSSLLEWTHPGYGNDGVNSLRDAGAGDGGAYRNITEGGAQADSSGFPERADAVLIYVPGWGPRGVLIGLGGGADDELTENMEDLDVFDIETSEWYRQETSGDHPPNRVNPCATIASAPDASSFQIYLFGGQDLPFGNQTQYNDMYILTIPAFHWIRVNANDDSPSSSSFPAPRAGHTCTMRDGQMVLVGGYIGEEAGCDSPGIYVFNATSLEWADGFVAGDHDAGANPDNSVLAGSWGYRVPDAVQSVIGGDGGGSATVTTPSSGASGGPFATGTPPVFTVTEAAPGVTGADGSAGGGGGDDDDDGEGSSGAANNPGLIAAGVIAGLLGLLAGYLGFCAWLYRRQVAAYKQHLAVANRYSGVASTHSFGFGGIAGGYRSLGGGNGEKKSSAGKKLRRPGAAGAAASGGNTSGEDVQEEFSWVAPGVSEPKWMSDGPSPGSGSATAAGSGSGPGSNSNARRSEDVRAGRSSDGRGSKDTDADSVSSTEQLLDGQEPSFFSVVMGPRRALRVVNGPGGPGAPGSNAEHQ